MTTHSTTAPASEASHADTIARLEAELYEINVAEPRIPTWSPLASLLLLALSLPLCLVFLIKHGNANSPNDPLPPLFVGFVYAFPTLITAAIIWALLAASTNDRRRARLSTQLRRLQVAELSAKRERDPIRQLNVFAINVVEKYYGQAQQQSQLAFGFALVFALVSFALVGIGVQRVYSDASEAGRWAGLLASIFGALNGVVAGWGFWMYNRTAQKMAEYHQKLVLTQNVALAVHLAAATDDRQLVTRVIDHLMSDINAHLVGATSLREPASVGEARVNGVPRGDAALDTGDATRGTS